MAFIVTFETLELINIVNSDFDWRNITSIKNSIYDIKLIKFMISKGLGHLIHPIDIIHPVYDNICFEDWQLLQQHNLLLMKWNLATTGATKKFPLALNIGKGLISVMKLNIDIPEFMLTILIDTGEVDTLKILLDTEKYNHYIRTLTNYALDIRYKPKGTACDRTLYREIMDLLCCYAEK